MIAIHLIQSDASTALHAAFHKGLQSTFSSFGAPKAVSAPAPDPRILLLTAIDGHGRLRGGFRLHPCEKNDPLPLAHALGDDVGHVAQQKGGPNLMEPRALWVNPEDRGSGLGASLLRSIIAAAPLFGGLSLVFLSHDNLMRFHSEGGFFPDFSFGAFNYPDARFRSHVYWCAPETLVGVHPKIREDILTMRTAFARNDPVWIADGYALARGALARISNADGSSIAFRRERGHGTVNDVASQPF